MLENKVKKIIKDGIKEIPGFLYHANPASMYGQRGWPDGDIIHGPYTLRIEFKGTLGKLSLHQEALIENLLKNNIPVAIVRPIQDGIVFLIKNRIGYIFNPKTFKRWFMEVMNEFDQTIT